MFGIDWSELMIIAVVAIIVIGPKDLPKVMRSLGKATSKMRSSASEFRQQFNEAMKEAELDDVHSTLNEIRNLDPRRSLTKVLDPFRDAANDVKQSLSQTHDALKGISSPSLNDQKNVGDSDSLSPSYYTNDDEYIMRDHSLSSMSDEDYYSHQSFDASGRRQSKAVKHHASFEMKRPLRQHCLKRNNARFSYNRHGRKAAGYCARSKKRHLFDEAIKYNVNGAKNSDE